MLAISLRRIFIYALRAGICGLTVTLASNLHAAVIFSDDFNRGNSSDVGNLWQEWEKDSNDVAVYSQQLRLRDHQNSTVDAAIWHSVDTSGFENLNLSFDWRAANNTEASDTLFAGWRDTAGTFHSLWSQTLGGSAMATHSIDLDAFGLNDLFDLSFWVDVSASTETVYLDNILLSGDAINISTTPTHGNTPPAIAVNEPALPGLLAIAASLLLMRRKTSRHS